MNKKLTCLFFLVLSLCGILQVQAITVHTIGDSTMQTYDESSTVTRGWAQYFQQFFQNVTINNRGKAGASSKSFYQEPAYWQSVKQQMQPGDYVLIQFSHNDEKNNGMDGDELKAYYNKVGETDKAAATDYRGTTPSGTYKNYLRKYVEETRAAGCHPVLVAPICRMYFSGNTIRRAGQHDLGDKFSKLTDTGVLEGQSVPVTDHSMDYVYQMKSVAEELNVPFIDLTTATKNLYLSYGDAKCHDLLSDNNGSTHLSTIGATLIARQAATLLKAAGILVDNIVIPSDLSVSPAEADLGEGYKGQTMTKEISVNGFGLTPADGSVKISATAGLKVSLDKTTWADQISIPYSEGMLVKNFYVQIELTATGCNEGIVTLIQGSKTIKIPVKATAISLEGGTAVKAYWRLEKNDECQLTGPVTVVPQSFEGMYVQKYSSPNANTVWPEWTGYDATRKTQRCLIVGDNWPEGEIDEVSTRYIQFGITAAKGTTLKIDNISMFVCGCGGNGMRCHINYSKEPNFANQHTIFSPTSMPANNMLEVKDTPVISLDEGETLLVRVYPWYDGKATRKTICLSDVTISGMALDKETTGISNLQSETQKSDCQYYTLLGVKVDKPGKGIYICNNKKVVFK
ncbi:hypothetical protein F7D20_10650 [Prevotella copri]|uniref:SGNH hydrolase-type esterase domain-containing protein n=1 Tax=Segatella copri TaxID=165179 RepID=A0A6A7WDE0_9BACT|nr:GDSL-type esterase/lipase family protein [Segatella copri]MQP12401.1 hypothetical protein [Segatella copri]